jgi:hypothetical protein
MLRVSDKLYERLEKTARRRGLEGIEELLESWQNESGQREDRLASVQRVEFLRKRLSATYGEMPDSVDLIRADRER